MELKNKCILKQICFNVSVSKYLQSSTIMASSLIPFFPAQSGRRLELIQLCDLNANKAKWFERMSHYSHTGLKGNFSRIFPKMLNIKLFEKGNFLKSQSSWTNFHTFNWMYPNGCNSVTDQIACSYVCIWIPHITSEQCFGVVLS